MVKYGPKVVPVTHKAILVRFGPTFFSEKQQVRCFVQEKADLFLSPQSFPTTYHHHRLLQSQTTLTILHLI